ncbi:MAG TPA: hypothetical protein VH138_11780 [Vicinamibacterales bacterium]|jgi:hypothetical protein|nr:hypothetical protein [Vicinamibacterales bacterium]
MTGAVLDEIGLDTQVDDIEYWERIYQMHPSSVTVSRTSDEDFKQRQLVIWVDGERLGDLMFGNAFSQDVAPGRHTLRVSNTLVWKTVTFDVKPGEQVRFEVVNRPGKLTYPMLVMLGVGPLYVTIKRVS